MSKLTDEFQVRGPVEVASQTVRNGIATLGWDVKESEPPARFVVGVKMSAFSWPGKVELLLNGSGDSTNVTMNGSIMGFGPVQKGHLQKQMTELRGAIETAVV